MRKVVVFLLLMCLLAGCGIRNEIKEETQNHTHNVQESTAETTVTTLPTENTGTTEATKSPEIQWPGGAPYLSAYWDSSPGV